MDQSPEGSKSDLPQQNRQEQGLTRGINTINNSVNLVHGGTKSPFGKISSRLAAQTGSKAAAFLFTTPAGWVALGITAVVVVTLIITLSLGPPDLSGNKEGAGVIPAEKTGSSVGSVEIITPAPAP